MKEFKAAKSQLNTRFSKDASRQVGAELRQTYNVGRTSRSLGNTYRAQIQSKLQVDAPDESHEVEADRVADRVVNMPAPLLTPVARHNTTPDVQRACTSCEEEEHKNRTPPRKSRP